MLGERAAILAGHEQMTLLDMVRPSEGNEVRPERSETESGSQSKPLLNRRSRPVAMLRGGSDDAGRRGLVSKQSYHLTADRFHVATASYDLAINAAWWCGNNQ